MNARKSGENSAITSYEKFCRAFSGTSLEQNRAALLLFVQDWIVRLAADVEKQEGDYSLDAFLESGKGCAGPQKDALSRLVENSRAAVYKIADSMRENIIRENVKMPIYKVREVNSRGLNWLSRRPGITLKEKIANSNMSMLAVRRRMSADTGENRLFKAYLKEMSDLLETKFENFPKGLMESSESDFASRCRSVVLDPENEEIRRWENMPPNNTLLSDKYYKQIWHGWNEMKEIDDIVADDDRNLMERLALIFMFRFMMAAECFAFPQVPLAVDYVSYRMDLYAKFFYGVNADGEKLDIRLVGETVGFAFKDKLVAVSFANNEALISEHGKKPEKLALDADSISYCVKTVLRKLGCAGGLMPRQSLRETVPERCEAAVVDLFSLQPRFMNENGEIREVPGRLLYQTHYGVRDGEEYRFEIPCPFSRAIATGKGIETHSVTSALMDDIPEKEASRQLVKLMHLMEHFLATPRFTFLFPDIYDEFQLSMLYRAVRLSYYDVKAFPRSIGAAFSYMKNPSFQRDFRERDFLLVVDMVGEQLTYTLVQGLYDKEIDAAIPEYRGILWERHPSVAEPLSDDFKDLRDLWWNQGCDNPERLCDVLGLNGLETENGRLTILSDKEHYFQIDAEVAENIRKSVPDVTGRIEQFVDRYADLIKDAGVHVVMLTDKVRYAGPAFGARLAADNLLQGHGLCADLQQRVEKSLWRDHLPELAIKLLYKKFSLIKNETVQPEFHREKKIRIQDTFTLPKGIEEYKLSLVRDEMNKSIRYAAVVRNPAFPLKKDTVCRLDMTYIYGADEPYQLQFIPVEKNAGFGSAKVSWERLDEYPYEDLPAPEALKPLSWKELRSFNGRRGIEDLISGADGLVEFLNDAVTGLVTEDLEYRNITIKGGPKNKLFVTEVYFNDGPRKVLFTEGQFRKGCAGFSMQHPGIVAFKCRPGREDRQRYELIMDKGYWPSLWRLDRNRKYFSIQEMEINGETVDVFFHQNYFDDQENFNTSIDHVSFTLVRNKKKRSGNYNDPEYFARNIHDEDFDPYETPLFAEDIRPYGQPSRNFYSNKFYFLMHTVMGSGNSVSDPYCPVELKEAFYKVQEEWLQGYEKCEVKNHRQRILGPLSIMAPDLGSHCYDLLETEVERYKSRDYRNFQNYIGYALGKLTSQDQKALLENILALRPRYVIQILSRAMWGHKDFVFNMDHDTLLTYLDDVVPVVEKVLSELERVERVEEKWPKLSELGTCLEYILGVYRLRELNDEEINKRLSLNNPAVRDIYQMLEWLTERCLNDSEMNIKTFLKLDVSDKGIYEAIPDLLYALLVYTSGEKNGNNIKIVGFTLGDVDEED